MVHAFGIVFNGVKEIWAQLMTAYVEGLKDSFPSRALLEDPQLLAKQELQKELMDSIKRGRVAQAWGVDVSKSDGACCMG